MRVVQIVRGVVLIIGLRPAAATFAGRRRQLRPQLQPRQELFKRPRNPTGDHRRCCCGRGCGKRARGRGRGWRRLRAADGGRKGAAGCEGRGRLRGIRVGVLRSSVPTTHVHVRRQLLLLLRRLQGLWMLWWWLVMVVLVRISAR